MKQLVLVLFIWFSSTFAQTVNNVRVLNHTEYVLTVIQKTITEVENREWCNLKVPNIVVPINEHVIDRHYEGNVTYSNGFLVSIQQVDVLQSSVQQIWAWTSSTRNGTVSLRGTLQMTDMTLGYDVLADLVGQQHRYTTTFTHPLISFAFSIDYSLENEEIVRVTVVGTVPRISTVLPKIYPKDMTSDVLTVLFDPEQTAAGITAWGADVLEPITRDVVTNVEFPRICYNCPVA